MLMHPAVIQSRIKTRRITVLRQQKIRPHIAIQSANKTQRTCAWRKQRIRKVTVTASVRRTQRISVWRRCAKAALILGIKRNRWQTVSERLEWSVFHLLNILDSLMYLLSGTLLKSGFAYSYLFRHEGGSY
jgi:hypothetical protein